MEGRTTFYCLSILNFVVNSSEDGQDDDKEFKQEGKR